MRENLPISLAAVVIIFSFGIVMLFVSIEVIEDKTSQEIELQEIPNILGNALQNTTQVQTFQQLWENP